VRHTYIKEGSVSGNPSFGGVVRRPVAGPRRIPFLQAGSIVAGASPSPTRDAFVIGDSNLSTKLGCDGASFHGTRSHGPSTPAEWNQSPAPRGLAAKVSAAWTELRGCPCLAPVSEVLAEDGIAVAQQVARQLVEGKGVPQLLPVHSAVGCAVTLQ
jgi:hypothetical protein